MRRLLRDVAEDQALGDTTTLADPSVVEGIKGGIWPGDRRRRVTSSRGRATCPTTGPGTTARSSPDPRSSSTSTACSPTPPAVSTTSKHDAPQLERVLRSVRRRPGDRGGEGAPRPARPRAERRAPPARPERVHHLTEAWLRRYRIRWDVLLMRPWGDYEMARDFSSVGVGPAQLRLRAAPRDRGRPPNVAMFRSEGVPCIYFDSGYTIDEAEPCPEGGTAERSRPCRTEDRLRAGRVGNAQPARSVARRSGPIPRVRRGERDEERTEDGRPARRAGRPVHARRRGHRREHRSAARLVLGLVFVGSSTGSVTPSRSGLLGEAGEPRGAPERLRRSSRTSPGAPTCRCRSCTFPGDQPNAFATGRNPNTPPSASPKASCRCSTPKSCRACSPTSCRT